MDIQLKHKAIGFNYLIRYSDSKTKVPVKIKKNNPAREFIKAVEKEAEQ
ncbi:17924_t:CDS:2, partial [Gigaspora margarita]